MGDRKDVPIGVSVVEGPIDPSKDRRLRTIYNNTCSGVATKFLTGAQLIQTATEVYKTENENWAYPIFSFGDDESNYYAEIWMNGMDYNYIYWVIETANHDTPKIYPLIFFPETKDRDNFQDREFRHLCKAFLYNRRYQISKDTKSVSYNDGYGIYRDMIWPTFRIMYTDGHQSHIWKTRKLKEKYGEEGEDVIPTMEGVEILSEKKPEWIKCVYGHASQNDCHFYIYRKFLESCLKTK